MTTYSFLKPPTNSEDLVAYVGNEIFPYLEKAWKEQWGHIYDKEFSPNAGEFSGAWAQKGFKIFVAMNADQKLEGILIAFFVKPTMYRGSVLQVDKYFGDTEEIEQGLVAYFLKAAELLEPDEIVFPLENATRPKVDLPKAKTFERTYVYYQAR